MSHPLSQNNSRRSGEKRNLFDPPGNRTMFPRSFNSELSRLHTTLSAFHFRPVQHKRKHPVVCGFVSCLRFLWLCNESHPRSTKVRARQHQCHGDTGRYIASVILKENFSIYIIKPLVYVSTINFFWSIQATCIDLLTGHRQATSQISSRCC